MNKKIGYY